ncbi:MAG: hypothetical protein HUU23_12490 [Caldilineales bacterium]|nr:hypothetical protein [Caldilineales bacterium]
MLVTDCHCCVIEENWKRIAAAAWAGYLNDGRGIVRIVAAQSNAPQDRPLVYYQPLAAGVEGDEMELARSYDPNREVVVCIVDAAGRHTCRASHLELTPPTVYAHSAALAPALTA